MRAKVWPEWFASEGKGSWAYKREERRYVAFKRKIFGIRKGAPNPPALRWVERQSRAPQSGERLYPSFVDERDPNHVSDVRRDGLSVGSALDYAEKHHEGRGRGPDWAGGYPLPRRSLVDLTATDIRRWDAITQKYLLSVGAIQGRGGSDHGFADGSIESLGGGL